MRRTSRSRSFVTSSRCSVVRWRDRGSPLPIVSCWRGSRDSCLASVGHLPRYARNADAVAPGARCRHWTYPPPENIAPNALDAEVVALVLGLARENSRWGYLRIVGELQKLGVVVSGTSVRNVLRRHRLKPAPRREDRPSRSCFAPRRPARWRVTFSTST